MGVWKETSRELVTKSFLFRLFRVGFRSETSGKEGQFDVLETKDWVNIIPITDRNEVVLVKQFRFGSKEVTLEFPAGSIEAGQTPLDAAKRELAEETGNVASSVEPLGWCRPNPAFLDNRCYHFVARGVRVTQSTAFDEFEEIEVELVPLEKIDSLILGGQITHTLAITAWHLFKQTEKYQG